MHSSTTNLSIQPYYKILPTFNLLIIVAILCYWTFLLPWFLWVTFKGGSTTVAMIWYWYFSGGHYFVVVYKKPSLARLQYTRWKLLLLFHIKLAHTFPQMSIYLGTGLVLAEKRQIDHFHRISILKCMPYQYYRNKVKKIWAKVLNCGPSASKNVWLIYTCKSKSSQIIADMVRNKRMPSDDTVGLRRMLLNNNSGASSSWFTIFPEFPFYTRLIVVQEVTFIWLPSYQNKHDNECLNSIWPIGSNFRKNIRTLACAIHLSCDEVDTTANAERGTCFPSFSHQSRKYSRGRGPPACSFRSSSFVAFQNPELPLSILKL